jgi:8-oxo-dGTP diphosphatase
VTPLPLRGRTDGDGWVRCTCGRRHWGRFGAAGLLLRHGQEVLLQHRALWSHEGGTWGLPGGARTSGEDALSGALREAHEEAGVPVDAVRPSSAWTEDHGAWSYTTVVATTDRRVPPVARDAESVEVAWVGIGDVDSRPLHPGLATLWPDLVDLSDRRLALLVDAANVVGSRPDGWWRDRAAATSRLREGLDGLSHRGIPSPALEDVWEAGDRGPTHWWPDVVLVVEGAARRVPAAGAVEVVPAAGSGDDALVGLAETRRRERPGDLTVAITADRDLRRRLDRGGVPTLGPGWLLRRLP